MFCLPQQSRPADSIPWNGEASSAHRLSEKEANDSECCKLSWICNQISQLLHIPPASTSTIDSQLRGSGGQSDLELSRIVDSNINSNPPKAASSSTPHHAQPVSTTVPATTTAISTTDIANLWFSIQLQLVMGAFPLDVAFNKSYRLEKILGEGSFGFVWSARRRSDSLAVAVKFISRDRLSSTTSGALQMDSVLGLCPAEILILRKLNHPRIIKFVDYYWDDRFCYLITELHGTSWSSQNPRLNAATSNEGLRFGCEANRAKACPSPSNQSQHVLQTFREAPYDLFECIEAHLYLPLKTIKHIFSQLVDALLYLHLQGICHRDLKDENIAIDEAYNVKLIDFGSAVAIPKLANGQEGYLDRFCGTVAFAAPEIIAGQRYRASEAEAWTLGVLLYTMFFRKPPFATPQAIEKANLEIPRSTTCGPAAQDLLRRLLDPCPTRRIQLADIPSHAFLSTTS